MRDIELPRDLIWIEYDNRKLWDCRCAREITTLGKEDLSKRLQRGFLFDNRSSENLSVRLFSAVTDTIFFDAPFVLEISKSQDGRPDFGDANWQPQRTVLAGLVRAGLLANEASLREHFEEDKGHLTYEMVIGYMLFAALAAREDDLASQEVASLSTSQTKTARKSGKAWMTEVLKSHVTIRIGPAGERHITEQGRGFASSKHRPQVEPRELSIGWPNMKDDVPAGKWCGVERARADTRQLGTYLRGSWVRD